MPKVSCHCQPPSCLRGCSPEEPSLVSFIRSALPLLRDRRNSWREKSPQRHPSRCVTSRKRWSKNANGPPPPFFRLPALCSGPAVEGEFPDCQQVLQQPANPCPVTRPRPPLIAA